MHRENDIDVVNAKKALQRICENNPKFVFETDGNEMMALMGEKHSGKGGVLFMYSTNGMIMYVGVADSVNQIEYTIKLKEKNEVHWYYEEYQRLYKIASESLNTIKNK
jgi:hypothetical protein